MGWGGGVGGGVLLEGVTLIVEFNKEAIKALVEKKNIQGLNWN